MQKTLQKALLGNGGGEVEQPFCQVAPVVPPVKNVKIVFQELIEEYGQTPTKVIVDDAAETPEDEAAEAPVDDAAEVLEAEAAETPKDEAAEILVVEAAKATLNQVTKALAEMNVTK